MTLARLPLANSLRTRPNQYGKDARAVNSYVDERPNSPPMVRKRPAASVLGLANIGAAQMLGPLLEAHTNIGFVSAPSTGSGETSGVTTANAWTSATKTTVVNCSSVTASVSFLSSRGVGDGTWYRRSVRWRFEYHDGASWVTGSFRTVAMGDQTSTPVSDSHSLTFPSSAVWQWRVYAEAFDTNGTTFGTATYTYSQETVNAPNVLSGTLVPTTTQAHAISASFGAPSGTGEIYQITYNATVGATAQMTTAVNDIGGMRFSLGYGWPGAGGTYGNIGANPYPLNNTGGALMATSKAQALFAPVTNTLQTWAPAAQSQTVTGSNLTFNSQFWAVGCSRRGSTPNTMNITMSLTNMSATIFRRVLTSSNTTATANTYTVDSYSWSVAGGDPGFGVNDPTKAVIYIVGDEIGMLDLSGVSP